MEQQIPGSGNAKAALILGILSLVLGNVILGIIGLVQANKAYALGFTGGKAKAGKILSIIGIIVSVILIIIIIASGAAAASYSY